MLNLLTTNDTFFLFLNSVELPSQINLELYDSFLDMFLNKTASTHNPLESFLQDSFSVFHVSVPNIKLYYPEPFIATPTFVHDDIWFLHIVIYQYWLWFLFIFIVVFFFLMFLITLRWCNIRNRPARETRGVSRSKCGDLITATVPVSWATSIIIHESADAIELQDGFGSTEMAVGIRAYQWGWEYYYPKDLDFMFRTNTSKLVGNSLYQDYSLGKNSEFYYFKSNYLNSDFLNPSPSSSCASLLSLSASNNINSLDSRLFSGQNSLIARNSANHITSTKVFNLENVYSSRGLNQLTGFLNYYKKFSFYDLFANTSLFVNNQFYFFNNKTSIIDSGLNTNDIASYIDFMGQTHGIHLTQYGALDSSNIFNVRASAANLNKVAFPDQLYFQKNDSCGLVSSNMSKLFLSFNGMLGNSYSQFFNFFLFSDQDFKRWSSAELLEDLVWSNSTLNQLYVSNLDFGSVTGSDKRYNLKHTSLFETSYFSDIFYNTNFYSSASSFYRNLNNHLLYSNSTTNWISDSIGNSFSNFKIQSELTLNFKNWLFKINTFFINTSNSNLNALYSGISTRFQTPIFKSSTQSGFFSFNSSVETLFSKSDQTVFYKNLNSYYSALWKVFKSTLDEERGHFTVKNFSNVDFKLPMIMTAPGTLLETLQKNNNSSFVSTPVFQTFFSFESPDAFLANQQYINSFSFPFSLSFESDIIRYSWFDWYSSRNSIITKAIDTSVFNLNAVKDYDFTFTNKPDLAVINRADNFFLKYSMSRKMHVPGYYYAPYFLSKHLDWYSYNSLLLLVGTNSLSGKVSFQSLKLMINLSKISYKDLAGSNYSHTLNSLNSNFSTIYSSNRSYFSAYNSFKNNTHIVSLLFDILSKKDYLLKSLNDSSSFLQDSAISSTRPDTKSPLIQLVKLIGSVDSNLQSSGIQESPKFKSIKYTLLSNIGAAKKPSLTSQYQPLKKGIVNMIRIQADKAIAMPTDTRIQILAVSKDIIHSWAIPSAGIKIDCIPGYSSHRVAIFTLSGVYWGQCMEICGRFHHWMPIVVYFIRRDLFCLWCVHFIYKNAQTNGTLHALDSSYRDNFAGVSVSEKLWNYDLL